MRPKNILTKIEPKVFSITDETPKRQGFFTKLWLPAAIQDPTLLWSTLTFATVWLDLLGLQYDGFRPLTYKAKTIDSINKSLQSPKTALSQSTIAAVALLATIAVGLPVESFSVFDADRALC